MEKKLDSQVMILIFLLGCTIFISPSAGLTTSYITIDPVGDHTIGDLVNVTGTTNLPVNTTFVVQAGPRVFTNYEPNYFFKIVQVGRGNDVNTWSVLINTSTFSVDEYNLIVDRVEGSSLTNNTRFNMTPKDFNWQTTADISLTSGTLTPTTIKNQTPSSDSVIPTIAKPAPLPETVPFIALGCVMAIVIGRKVPG
jgi:hypothetical protein